MSGEKAISYSCNLSVSEKIHILHKAVGKRGINGKLQYLQVQKKPLNEHSSVTRDRFSSLFAELFPQLHIFDEHSSATVKKDG
jgi:hypothetical protein